MIQAQTYLRPPVSLSTSTSCSRTYCTSIRQATVVPYTTTARCVRVSQRVVVRSIVRRVVAVNCTVACLDNCSLWKCLPRSVSYLREFGDRSHLFSAQLTAQCFRQISQRSIFIPGMYSVRAQLRYGPPDDDICGYLVGVWKRSLEWREFGPGFQHLRTRRVQSNAHQSCTENTDHYKKYGTVVLLR